MGPLTIFRVAVVESDDDALGYAARELDANVEQASLDELRVRVLPALMQGPVLLIAADDRMSTVGLALGVDEVLRAGEITRESLREAVERSRVRESVRSLRAGPRGGVDADADEVLAFLITGFARQLREPLVVASIQHGLLDESLPVVFDISDELAGWAALSAPTEELRRLVARRVAAPKSAELMEAVQRLGGALIRAQCTMGLLQDLIGADATDGSVDCGVLAVQLCECLAGQVRPFASLSVDVREGCVAEVPKGALALALVSLVLRASRSVEPPARRSGSVELKVYAAEGAVVVEVCDNGGLTRADLRLDMRDGAFLDPAASPRTGLGALRDRVRSWGGELLVDTDVVRTTVRLILPRASETLTDASVAGQANPRRDFRPD